MSDLLLKTKRLFCGISNYKKLVSALLSSSRYAGGTMRTIYAAAIWTMFLIAAALPVRSEAQTAEGYTFITGAGGAQVCLGRWVPSRDVALPGFCEGQLVDLAQFTAISSRLSADRLDQMLFALGSIDQRLALNNEQVSLLIEATVNTRTAIDEQGRLAGELLQETIARRFDSLPDEILANDAFREELAKLKKDILKEVERLYQKRPASQKK
jgi:hypothetical protein